MLSISEEDIHNAKCFRSVTLSQGVFMLVLCYELCLVWVITESKQKEMKSWQAVYIHFVDHKYLYILTCMKNRKSATNHRSDTFMNTVIDTLWYCIRPSDTKMVRHGYLCC